MNLSEYRKTVKYIIKLLLIFIMMFVLSLGVMAATDEINTTADNAPITFTETDITGDIDFSELPVTVTRQVGDQKTIIYKGKLGGYDNGRLNFTDFSTIDILICADYNTLGEEWIYVIPDNGKLTADLVENSYAVASLENLSSDIKCNVNLMYDNVFRENVMLFGKQLSVPITVTNSGNTEKTVACYISEYDESGRMIGAVSEKNVTVPANTSAGIVAKKTFNADAKETKIFLWDKETGKPLTSPVTMSETEKDYFGNSFSDAQELDISHHIEGKINTSSDVDYIKIVPKKSGEYTFLCMNISGITCDLYNADEVRKKLNSDNFTYELEQGKPYYIKVHGDAPGIYIISIQCDVSDEALNFNVYDFDEKINNYKQSILEICEDLLWDNKELSEAMYKEYELILTDDAKIHELPSFLKGHPKYIEDFDDVINRYFGTRYSEFVDIEERYIALIDKYTVGNIDTAETINEQDNYTPYIIRGKSKYAYNTNASAENEEIMPAALNEPSLTVVETTETSIKINAVFPVSGNKLNSIYVIDFNESDGLTTYKYAKKSYADNGEYIISDLSSGGIYIIEMSWSANPEDCIYRFVQLPDNSDEILKRYEGKRVVAYMEEEDKELATNENFDTWLNRMDLVYDNLHELTGYTPFNSQKIIMQSTRENLNDYFEIEDGNDYWWVIFGCFDGTHIFKHGQAYYRGHMRRLSEDDWGDAAIHELCHVFDDWKWIFDAETLAQFKIYYIMEKLNAKIYRPDRYDDDSEGWYEGDEYYDLLKYDRFLDSYDQSFNNGYYASEGFSVILIDIKNEIGWEPFKQTFRYFSKLSWSQIPDTDGEVLKLFLTKLREFSGHDILDYISDRDKGIIEEEFDITLGYVNAPYIEAEEGSGGGYEITEKDGDYTIHQFIPVNSESYCIFTSPYGGSGVSNDTIIEIYEGSVSGELIASNDDYNGSRFSKVTVLLTAGTTYYIKVRHSGTGQLHADLNITKDIPAENLSLDTPVDIRVWEGESALCSFTPSESLTYIFEVSNYNSGSTEYDTYIKLYDDANLTNRLAQDNTKIMVNLEAHHTYYLKFSGFFMEYAKGRITVRQGQTLEFLKRTDSSFIYVNNPEFITKEEIVDAIEVDQSKIFEQKKCDW